MIKLIPAALIAASLPIAASAVTISGQIDIASAINLDNSDVSVTGNADLLQLGVVIGATGDFGAFASFLDLAVIDDIDFTAPATIWSVAGFTFMATSFSNFVNGQAAVGFTAQGLITGNGFDATDGVFAFSANPLSGVSEVSFSSVTTTVPVPAGVLLLGTALVGFGILGRKRA